MILHFSSVNTIVSSVDNAPVTNFVVVSSSGAPLPMAAFPNPAGSMMTSSQLGPTMTASMGGPMVGQMPYGNAIHSQHPHQQQHPTQWAAMNGQDFSHHVQSAMYSNAQPSRPTGMPQMTLVYGQQQPLMMNPMNCQPMPPKITNNGVTTKKGLLKRKSTSNAHNVPMGNSMDDRSKKPTYPAGMVQQQPPMPSMMHNAPFQQQSSSQMYQNGAGLPNGVVHSPQYPSPSTPLSNTQHLSPYAGYDAQQMSQQQFQQPQQWANKRPNSRSELVRMELRNSVQARQNATSPNPNPLPPPHSSVQQPLSMPPQQTTPTNFMQPLSNDSANRFSGTPKVEPSMMSPPRSHPASFAPHGTPPAGCGNMSQMMNSNNMSAFNENNNNAHCNNHNTMGQQNFYHPNTPQSQQQQHPNMPPFQRSCSMSNVIGTGTGQPSQFVFFDDCSTIELYDFKLSTAGFDMDNDETRMLVQKLLQ
ncbi:hypothetical protein Ddc_03122 [Ditylenchus destructor]|nr:hypothetical protein Ddc_03122 [Ditylenchus destructor]